MLCGVLRAWCDTVPADQLQGVDPLACRCCHHIRVSYTEVMNSTVTKTASQPNASQPRIGGS
jgi:hypothetical protein